MRTRHTLAATAAVLALPLVVACGAVDTSATTATPAGSSASSAAGGTSSDSSASTGTSAGATGQSGTSQMRGPGNSVDVSSVSTEEQLVALVNEAYGEAQLGLHRGHQPIQDVLTAVLGISHDELHVRMEQKGQNLAAVSTDLGIDPQTLIDALVADWGTAVQNVVDSGAIDQQQADAYTAALEEAFSWRVNWDGSEATPTFTGIDA